MNQHYKISRLFVLMLLPLIALVSLSFPLKLNAQEMKAEINEQVDGTNAGITFIEDKDAKISEVKSDKNKSISDFIFKDDGGKLPQTGNKMLGYAIQIIGVGILISILIIQKKRKRELK